MPHTHPVFPTFEKIKRQRSLLRNNSSYSGSLKQGTIVPYFNKTPYFFKDSIRYLNRLFSNNPSADLQEVKDFVKKGTSIHQIGVRDGKILSASNNNNKKTTESIQGPTILFVGDVMVSESGKSILIDKSLESEISNADALVLNVEASLNGKMIIVGRDGILFEMPKIFLQEFIEQIKKMNPNIKIIYSLANNHNLDGIYDEAAASNEEKEIYKKDPGNFSLNRSIAVIKEIDKNAAIIGVHINDLQMTVIEKNEIRFGIIGVTDLLNNNAEHWDKKVVRSEDITPQVVVNLKKKYQLDQLSVFMHANIELQPIPSPKGQKLAKHFHDMGVNICIGHGPHVAQTNEIYIGEDGDGKLIVHSLGNCFGPKNLLKTGGNSLLKLNIQINEKGYLITNFLMEYIEAYINEQERPIIILADKQSAFYPDLYSRFEALYPKINNEEIYQHETEKDTQLVSLSQKSIEGKKPTCYGKNTLFARDSVEVELSLIVEKDAPLPPSPCPGRKGSQL